MRIHWSEAADGLRSSPRAARRAARGVCIVALVACATPLVAQPTAAGTRIVNTAEVTFELVSGQTLSVVSDALVLVVGQIAGVDIEPPGVAVVNPGSTASFPHTVRNMGNGVDRVTIAAQSKTGWLVRVYRDNNANGVLDASDALVREPITLSAGGIAAVLVTVDVPRQPAVRGAVDSVSVSATSLFDGAVADRVTDHLQVRDAGIQVTLTKEVDRTTASVGEILTYTVRYAATGDSRATNLRVSDPIPLGTVYVPGTLRLNGVTLSDSPGDDSGAFELSNNRVLVVLPAIAGGERGVITFQVRVSR